MSKKHKRLELYIAVMLIVSVIAVALRTTALFLDFNTSTNYFDSKVIINIASIFLAASSLFLFTYAFFSESKSPLIASFNSPATFAPTTVVVIALVYFSIEAFSKVASLGTTLEEAIATSDIAYFIWTGLSFLALFAGVYFVLNALVEKRASIARASFGLLTVIFLALYSAQFFFSTELQLNAPNKVVDQLAYLFAALFFLYEIRISLGRECWHLYIAFGFIAATMLAYSAFPTLIYYIFTGRCVSANIFEVALTVALFLFVASRLILTESLVEEKISDTVVLIKEAFEKKSAYIAGREPIVAAEIPEPVAGAMPITDPEGEPAEDDSDFSEAPSEGDDTPHYDPEATAQDESKAAEPDVSNSDNQ